MRQAALAGFAFLLVLAPASASAETETHEDRRAQSSRSSPIVESPIDVTPQFSARTMVYAGGGREPDHIESAATETVRYQYDDDSFEAGITSDAMQAAQRFRLRDHGTVRWLEACFSGSFFETNSEHTFHFDILSDRDGSPGSSLIGKELIKSGDIPPWPHSMSTCLRLNYSHRISRSHVWVAVRFVGIQDIQNPLAAKYLRVDTGKPRDTTARARRVPRFDGDERAVGPWQTISDYSRSEIEAGALGIRMAVDHETEDPPTDGPCLPTTDVLQFDGGYRVSMCYVTHQGDTGQAKAGVWASSQSGILWFFSRENAEVLVKVLDGCRHNGHRWVFVAPVTDVGFELRVTAPDGEIWTHTNQVGATAPTRSDTSAFRCQGT